MFKFKNSQLWITTFRCSRFSKRSKLRLSRCYASLTESSDIEKYFDIKGSTSPLESSDFQFYRHFFNDKEQSILLRSSLNALDSNDSPRARKRRVKQSYSMNISHARDMFLEDQFYTFEEVISFFSISELRLTCIGAL